MAKYTKVSVELTLSIPGEFGQFQLENMVTRWADEATKEPIHVELNDWWNVHTIEIEDGIDRN